MAVNCWVLPIGMDGLAGVRAMETNAGAVTVRRVEPWIEPESAWIVVPPWLTLLANPLLLMEATPVADELQVTEPVRFCVLPSV